MIDSKKLLKLLERVGQDLRKSGYLIGLGFVGLVVSNDNISTMEAITLLFWGTYCWFLGHAFLYFSGKSEQGDSE